MPSKTIPQERIARLNDKQASSGKYTLYWMQQSQRAECNHALEYAIQRANAQGNRLLVCFGLTDQYPEANLRHFQFMLEGLQHTERMLRRRKIPFVLRLGSPDEVAIELAKEATEVVCDRGYLRHQMKWRTTLARAAECRVWQVEGDAIVPVATASSKREYAARTIRAKLQSSAPQFLVPLATTPIDKHSLNVGIKGVDLKDIQQVLARLQIDRTVQPASWLAGGTAQAKARLKDFLSNSLSRYEQRTQILNENVSHLSPYLHFGQISPMEVALEIKACGVSTAAQDAFLEELLVRRELAINFVHYESDYDSLSSLPDWAAETLSKHEDDARDHQYTKAELENGETHDEAWNAAMTQMRHRGYLHNHLRMYWGKKIIEWTNTTRHAYRIALALNNRYFLDGRDASSYTNILWLFGLHDRAHQERDIFGKVRYMSPDGLKRKFDVEAYVRHVAECYDEDG